MVGYKINDHYRVSPQITQADIPSLVEDGITTVICNRPDGEVPAELSAAEMRKAVEAAGLSFVENPFSHSAFDMALVDRQDAALSDSDGPVFAYCASGNRSTVLWAMGRARAGEMTPDEIVSAAAEAGYDLRGMLPQLQALAG